MTDKEKPRAGRRRAGGAKLKRTMKATPGKNSNARGVESKLCKATLADLARSGLDAKDAKALGIVEQQAGFGGSAYLIPYRNGTDFHRIRFHKPRATPDGKKMRYWQPPGSTPELYLPPLGGVDWEAAKHDAAVALVVTEGEKKAAAACKCGIACIGLGGVWNWRTQDGPISDWDAFDFDGRPVLLCFDSDAATNWNVQLAEYRLGEMLRERGARVLAIRLADDGGGKLGLDDFLMANDLGEGDLVAAAKAFHALEPQALDMFEPIALLTPDGKPRAQASVLIDLGSRHFLFHDEGRQAFARIPVGDHEETHPIEAGAYREILSHAFYQLTGRGCNRNALGDAITTLAARAKFEGPCQRVWLRVAATGHGIAIDTGNDEWSQFHVTPEGWDLQRGDGEVFFYRAGKPLALPTPAAKGAFSKLWLHLNVARGDRVLVAAFLLAALRPSGPYPLLVLSGEQGTGKSSASRMLKALVDPAASALRSPPKEARDLLVAALNSWLVAVDNISYLSAQLSDALCRISTGGAISERTLYSNLDETLVEVTRPMLLNGIEEVASRPDLSDRSIHVELEPLTKRKTERLLRAEFEADLPAIFAGLLDGLSAALRNVAEVKLERPPRMADFAAWAVAGLPALGFTADEFLVAYEANRQGAMTLGLESNAIGRALIALLDMRAKAAKSKRAWSGTATELLQALTTFADESATRSKSWPRSGRAMSGQLKRLGPALRAAGIEAKTDKVSRGRIITVSRAAKGDDAPGEKAGKF